MKKILNETLAEYLAEYEGINKAIGFNYEKQRKYVYLLSVKLNKKSILKFKILQGEFEKFLESLDIDHFMEFKKIGSVTVAFKATNNFESYSIMDQIEKFLDTNKIEIINATFSDSTKPGVHHDIKDFLKRQHSDNEYRVTNIGPRFEK